MDANYLVWGTVRAAVERCEVMDEHGNRSPDLETQKLVMRALAALRRFYAENGLLKVEPFDAKGNLIDREYRRNDFTEDGLELVKRKEGAWRKSKASQKDPPDMKLLEKALAEIRSGK